MLKRARCSAIFDLEVNFVSSTSPPASWTFGARVLTTMSDACTRPHLKDKFGAFI